MSKHNLVEYGLAKEAVKDLHDLKQILDLFYTLVYKHNDYLAASYVLDAISESLHLIDRQYKAAKKVLELKGQE